ncbi:MAG: HipA domain-containing protein [Bacteroidota bacterium]|nr:HipA domain-containing protein [Bacteroidota bacterium]
MSNIKKDILVYANWTSLKEPLLMGALTVTPGKGKEIFSFEYKKEWIESGFAFMLDPQLNLYTGPQYLSSEKRNFGIFLDSCPDRWGQVLMQRREDVIAKQENRKPKKLWESDYLLGVYDGHRMGALRFKESENGPFLNDNKEMGAPPWTSLRELENASLKYEDDNSNDPEYLNWLNLLIAPGSSLGGARPKASISDPKGNLWIAKFPSKNDVKDIGAWEMVANQLAIKAGLNMSEAKIQKFNSKYHTYLTKRFDRTANGERIHFASAMTLLGHTDGQEGASYLELAGFLMKQGANVEKDLHELWRRIVFSVCVKNTDDHLRNHGFLLTKKGWTLSPAYDINPVEYGTGLSLNISETGNALDLDLVLEVAEHFRLDKKEAIGIINQIKNAVSKWEEVAKQIGISRTEQDRMAAAFDFKQ